MTDDDRSWNDDDRPSWRELDKRRDRSTHRKDEKPAFEGTKKQKAYARTLALSHANKLFVPKKDAAQQQAEEELAAARGGPAFADVARAFFEKYGLTKDWRVQLHLAEAPLSEIAVPAIEAIAAAAPKLAAAEKRNAANALEALAMTGKTKVKMAAKLALAALE